MKKSIIADLLALILLVSFTACSNSNESQKLNVWLEKTEFNIGYLNSTAHLLAFVAKEEGLNVMITLFSSAVEFSSELESEKLDLAQVDAQKAHCLIF